MVIVLVSSRRREPINVAFVLDILPPTQRFIAELHHVE
jgi:hypothetical protein